jgi:hypothetical protein
VDATVTRLAALLVWTLLASACRPLYVPAVPADMPPFDVRLRVVDGAFLQAARPALKLSVVSAPDDGWLAVQWFGPSGDALASESVRVRVEGLPTGVTFELPQDALPSDVRGRFRAVVTFNEAFVGQWDTEWPN